MIAILKESEVRKMYKYRELCAVKTFGTEDEYRDPENDIVLTYADAGIMPDEDVINQMLSGDMSVKKFCKKLQNNVRNLKGDYDELAMNWACILNISIPKKDKDSRVKVKDGKVNPEPVLVFVLPDNTGDAETDREYKAKTKIYVKYITTMLDFFGMKAIMRTKDKKSKKLVAKFLKLFKGSNKKIIMNLVKFVRENPAYMPTKQYASIVGSIYAYYGIEIAADSYLRLNKEDSTKRVRSALTNLILDAMYCKNIEELQKSFAKVNKDVVKMCKRLRKKNEVLIKSLNQVVTILKEDDPNADITIPKKLKVGTKANKKKDMPKLAKKLYKGDGNLDTIVLALNVATYTIRSDESWGTPEYISGLRKYLAAALGKDIANGFCNVLKAKAAAKA